MTFIYKVNDRIVVELENLETVSTTEDGNGIWVTWQGKKEPQVFKPVSVDERKRFYNYLGVM
ncbi:MAG: hypothetical protein OEW12_03535 [Deltaproteobacteria bacterium]|nr:hypothetical protein [Deltaproteobacteria bacterium]